MAMADLNEEELAEAGPDKAKKREKLEAAINSYRRAIELGQPTRPSRGTTSSSSSGPGGGARR